MRNEYIVGDSISYLCITDNKEQSTVLFTIETEVITVNGKDVYMGLFNDKHTAGIACLNKLREVSA